MSQTINIEKLNQPLFADVYALYKDGREFTGHGGYTLKEMTLPTPCIAGHLNQVLGCFTPNISDDEAITKVCLFWDEGRCAYWVLAQVEGQEEYYAGYEIEPNEAVMNITDDESHEAWCQSTLNLWNRLEAYFR